MKPSAAEKEILTTSRAIIIGCILISLSILVSGGVISLKGKSTKANAVPSVPTQPLNNEKVADKKVDVKPLSSDDHIRGDRKARVLLIEYSDLECPFCKRFHPTAQQVVDAYKGQVAWVYRHFPLDQLHSKARKEAEATECAANLGGVDGFWKMTDKIYEVTPANNGLNLDDLPKLAAEVGLDSNKFKDCLDSGKYASKVEDDYQSGIKAGVTGTPGNILLDTKTGKTVVLPGAVPFDQIKESIDGILKS